ncbi:hypothetical protein EVA_15101 [gut metagenome]|uniref:Uncharacterized protein n=1 Tax=gut metagenome TaxID=749906 RepID=J9FQN2_9ZZZZ
MLMKLLSWLVTIPSPLLLVKANTFSLIRLPAAALFTA